MTNFFLVVSALVFHDKDGSVTKDEISSLDLSYIFIVKFSSTSFNCIISFLSLLKNFYFDGDDVLLNVPLELMYSQHITHCLSNKIKV